MERTSVRYGQTIDQAAKPHWEHPRTHLHQLIGERTVIGWQGCRVAEFSVSICTFHFSVFTFHFSRILLRKSVTAGVLRKVPPERLRESQTHPAGPTPPRSLFSLPPPPPPPPPDFRGTSLPGPFATSGHARWYGWRASTTSCLPACSCSASTGEWVALGLGCLCLPASLLAT